MYVTKPINNNRYEENSWQLCNNFASSETVNINDMTCLDKATDVINVPNLALPCAD